MNFRIIENYNEDKLYEDFKRDFINPEVTQKDIKEKYDMGNGKYAKLRKRVCGELGLKRKPSKPNIRKHIIKYYDKWVIRKKIDGDLKYFGTFKNFEDAQKVRDELVKCGWDKSKYYDIRKKVMKGLL